ncbi:rhodanese-like domain-containing protein [Acidisphaera sp. L21]|jgi:PQQ-dependent catabolism-associated CXXCW motif protein|uniref:rhodanese-like domain-containing protein n=1 Tax=Acidisphaera sp. L21 TaxID=1641851 RepID=UPI00131D708E|nr:rhodanese-like domain-containing protein [Acidisphaera sp. L21]
MRLGPLFLALAISLTSCATQPAMPWQQAPLGAPAYDNETQDFGLPAISTIKTGGYEAPTPMQIDGVMTVTTPQLRAMMISAKPPVLIDVIAGHQSVSLPGAVWLRGAGMGTGLDDDVQEQLGSKLASLTGGDKTRTLAFFCLSQTCWLSHNAALRATKLGYGNVLWYRGGRRAWMAAGLPMEPIQAQSP